MLPVCISVDLSQSWGINF